MQTIIDYLDLYFPRFMTEAIAYKKDGDFLIPIAPVKYLEDGESYDSVYMVSYFNLFSYPIFASLGEEVS